MVNSDTALAQVNPDRMRDYLWNLVEIPSPTGHEKKVAAKFADLLSKAGAAVEIDNILPDSPNVIGWLKGNQPGPVLQLAGHLDHIDIPHPPPQKSKDRISGRGSADMKNGLAGILEIVHILNQSGCNFPGEILITAYGLHEAPDGNSQGLLNLLKKGVKGQAAIVFEGPNDTASIMANGMAIWNLTFHHTEPPRHELCTDKDKFALPTTAAQAVHMLQQKNSHLQEQTRTYPLLQQESIFIGQVHYGDFYNRVSDRCFLQGTRRWNPGRSFQDIQIDFQQMLDSLDLPETFQLECNWLLVGDSYRITPKEKIVQCLQRAFERLHKKPLLVKGHNSVTDACRFVNHGQIPAVLWGFGTETGHADFEYVTTDQLVSSCRVALLTILDYLYGS